MRAMLAAAAAAAVIATGCTAGRDAVTIYSGREQALVGPLLERFSDDTGIPIDVRYGDSADLALLIAEEGDGTPADVFLSQSPGSVDFLAQRGLLARLPGGVVGAVPERFRSGRALWAGVTARRRVLVYNRDAVDESELPDSVFALTSPQYAGEVGIAPTNASFQDFVTAMRRHAGDERTRRWLEDMAAAGNPAYADNISIVDAVARGEIAMGLVNHYYNYRYLDENPGAPSRNHVFSDGDPGGLLIPSTVSVLESSGDERAVRLVSFLLSRAAQDYFARSTFEYPLAAGAEPSPELPPLSSVRGPAVDIEDLGDLRDTVEMIHDSGLL